MATDFNNYEIWKLLGDDLKDIEKRLYAIVGNPLYQKLMGIRIQDQLLKAKDRIMDIKSALENRMFSKVKPSRDDERRWLNIFWGNMHREEDKTEVEKKQLIKELAYCLFVATDRAIEKANETGQDMNRGQFLALIRDAFEKVLEVLPGDKSIQEWISFTNGRWAEVPQIGGSEG